MPECLTLQTGLFPIHKEAEFLGSRVPWESRTYLEDFKTARTTGGFFDLSDWGAVEVRGEDARDFLNRMTSLDFTKVEAGIVYHGALLTGRGLVLNLGMFLQHDQGFYFLVSPLQAAAAAEH